MRKKALILLVLSAAALLPAEGLRAQDADVRKEVLETARQARRPVRGEPMYFERDENGDTVFMETLDPVWIFPKGRRMRDGDWRRYYKLVFNFNKVYPYALVGRKMMAQVDSTIAADVSKRSERNRYINDVEKELFRLCEKDIRNMTITQLRQLVARLFSQNLKTRYDPSKGEDAKIEELCKIWDSGQWDPFYYSIFMEAPRKTVIQQETLDSEVRKKNR